MAHRQHSGVSLRCAWPRRFVFLSAIEFVTCVEAPLRPRPPRPTGAGPGPSRPANPDRSWPASRVAGDPAKGTLNGDICNFSSSNTFENETHLVETAL